MASADLAGDSRRRLIPHQTRAPGNGSPGNSPEILPEQSFNEDNLYGVRAAVAAHVATVADQRTVDTVVLIAHELASNAVRHGGGTGRLRLWSATGALYCEVSDGGSGLENPALAGQTQPAPSQSGGRGLWIARRLAVLHIASSPTGTTVTAAVPL